MNILTKNGFLFFFSAKKSISIVLWYMFSFFYNNVYVTSDYPTHFYVCISLVWLFGYNKRYKYVQNEWEVDTFLRSIMSNSNRMRRCRPNSYFTWADWKWLPFFRLIHEMCFSYKILVQLPPSLFMYNI